MKYNLRKSSIVIIAMLAFIFSQANEGRDIFKITCKPCHTIGGGRLVGPDLKNINEKRTQDWLIPYIQSSQTVIKSGDADAVAIYKEFNSLLMPDQPFDVGQVISIINYINETSSGAAVDNPSIVAVDLLENATEQNIADGRLLFSGKKRLTNSGASCISCHQVKDDKIFSSGSLAKDITETHEIMGSAGVSAILTNPPFPAMAATYSKNKLTKDEIYNLTSYLRSVSQKRYYQHPVDFGFTFAVLGVLVFVMILLTTILFYFKRKTKSVFHDIHSRQSPVIN